MRGLGDWRVRGARVMGAYRHCTIRFVVDDRGCGNPLPTRVARTVTGLMKPIRLVAHVARRNVLNHTGFGVLRECGCRHPLLTSVGLTVTGLTKPIRFVAHGARPAAS